MCRTSISVAQKETPCSYDMAAKNLKCALVAYPVQIQKLLLHAIDEIQELKKEDAKRSEARAPEDIVKDISKIIQHYVDLITANTQQAV